MAAASSSALIGLARQLIGTPYSWGGGGPGGPSYGIAQGAGTKGFDCSSFVQYLYASQGIQLPRTTYDQVTQGAPVDRSDLAPGDVLFFHATSRGPEHEGLYVGSGRFIEAPHTGASVRVSDLTGRSDFVTARRIIPEWAPPLHQVASAANPTATSGTAANATPLQVIRDYAPKVGLDPTAVIAYALTQGGTAWGAKGDYNETTGQSESFGPFQMNIHGAAAGQQNPEAWANTPQGLIAGMNMMAHAGASGLTGPDAAAFIVGPKFGNGANPARDMGLARAMYPKAASLLKQYPGPTGSGTTYVSGAATTGTAATVPPPPAVPYVPPPPPALSPYVPTPPAAEAAIVPLAVGAAPAAGTTAPTAKTPALRPGRPAVYDPAKDLALEPAEPSGPLRRLYPVAKLGQAAAAAPVGQSGGPLRRLFPVNKLGRG